MDSAPNYRFECGLDCGRTFKGDDLPKIARSVAWHWNKEHNDELGYSKKQIDTVERGGHHVHGNEYTVERIPIYLTSFDVMERLGLEDGHAVLPDDEDFCMECHQHIPDRKSAEVVEENVLSSDDLLCEECRDDYHREQKQENNRQLGEFGGETA